MSGAQATGEGAAEGVATIGGKVMGGAQAAAAAAAAGAAASAAGAAGAAGAVTAIATVGGRAVVAATAAATDIPTDSIGAGLGLQIAGTVSALAHTAPPPLSLAMGPLGSAIGHVAHAASLVKGNKREAQYLAERVEDCGAKMSEVVGVVKQLPVERVQGVTLQVQRLTTTVEETSRFLQAFGKQGFLKKMMAGQLDAEKFGECSESFILSYNMIIQLYIAELPANPLPLRAQPNSTSSWLSIRRSLAPRSTCRTW